MTWQDQSQSGIERAIYDSRIPWASRSYTSFNRSMKIRTLPESCSARGNFRDTAKDRWLNHTFTLNTCAKHIEDSEGWCQSLARAECRTEQRLHTGEPPDSIDRSVCAPSTSEDDSDDFDYAALMDRNDPRDQLSQTSSSITTLSWTYGPNPSRQGHWQHLWVGYSEDLWDPSEFPCWRWLLRHKRDRWTQLTLVNIMTQATFVRSNFSVSSAVVNPSFSSTSKRAGESFDASEKNNSHVIAPLWLRRNLTTRVRRGQSFSTSTRLLSWKRDSKREELCPQDPKQPLQRLEHHQALGDRRRLELHQAPGDRKP